MASQPSEAPPRLLTSLNPQLCNNLRTRPRLMPSKPVCPVVATSINAESSMEPQNTLLPWLQPHTAEEQPALDTKENRSSKNTSIVDPFRRFAKRFSLSTISTPRTSEKDCSNTPNNTELKMWRRRKSIAIDSVKEAIWKQNNTANQNGNRKIFLRRKTLLKEDTSGSIAPEDLSAAKRPRASEEKEFNRTTNVPSPTPYPRKRSLRHIQNIQITYADTDEIAAKFTTLTSPDASIRSNIDWESTTSLERQSTVGSVLSQGSTDSFHLYIPPTGVDGPVNSVAIRKLLRAAPSVQSALSEASSCYTDTTDLNGTPSVSTDAEHHGITSNAECPDMERDSGVCSELSSTRNGSMRPAKEEIDEEMPVGELQENEKDSTTIWSRILRQSLYQANRRRKLAAGLTLFNENPRKGLTYLVNAGVVALHPTSIACFLLQQEGLSRQAIGEYFCNLTDPMCSKVMSQFLKLIDLRGLEVDEGLRKLLLHFHPVGESQKISAIMEAFQEAYLEQNSEAAAANFRNPETIEVLAYSVMMLNTGLHNPNARKHGRPMTESDFVANNRGIDDGEDIDSDRLKAIYQRVLAAPFKCFPDPADQLRNLDSMLTGPLKTDTFFQRYRRFVGWCICQEVIKIAPRRSIGRTKSGWRHLLVFNDMLMVTKQQSTSGTSKLVNASTLATTMVTQMYRYTGSFPPSPSRRSIRESLLPPTADEEKRIRTPTYSTEMVPSGIYHVRAVVPLADLKVLVFETERYTHGVQLCTEERMILNINLPSWQGRQKLIDWIHGSIAEVLELQRYRNAAVSKIET